MLALFDSGDIRDGEQVTSLRRRRLSQRAAEWLGDVDRAIYELAEQGAALRVIARAVSLNHGTVSRRLGQVRRRLQSPVVQALLASSAPVPDVSRKIALLHLLGGRSISQLARTLNLSDAAVREHVRYASGIAQGLLRQGLV